MSAYYIGFIDGHHRDCIHHSGAVPPNTPCPCENYKQDIGCLEEFLDKVRADCTNWRRCASDWETLLEESRNDRERVMEMLKDLAEECVKLGRAGPWTERQSLALAERATKNLNAVTPKMSTPAECAAALSRLDRGDAKEGDAEIVRARIRELGVERDELREQLKNEAAGE